MNPDDFALSVDELDKTFDEEIVPWRFGGVEPTANPLAILIGAQPGAGKTRSGRDAIAASGQLVTPIIGDDLRLFHPSYKQLLQQSPADVPVATAQASGGWVERAIDYAAERSVSVLVEGTFRNTAVTLNTARQFKKHGFSVQSVLVAVSPEVSRASMAGRFVEDARRQGRARFTPLRAQDDSFRALRATLAALAAEGSPVDRLTICSRESIFFDVTRRGAKAIHGALAAAQSEWSRPLNDEEFTNVASVAEDAAEYFNTQFLGDGEVENLTRQLLLDREYIGLNRAGGVAVRGHLRRGGHVHAYSRALRTP